MPVRLATGPSQLPPVMTMKCSAFCRLGAPCEACSAIAHSMGSAAPTERARLRLMEGMALFELGDISGAIEALGESVGLSGGLSSEPWFRSSIALFSW